MKLEDEPQRGKEIYPMGEEASRSCFSLDERRDKIDWKAGRLMNQRQVDRCKEFNDLNDSTPQRMRDISIPLVNWKVVRGEPQIQSSL